ncbi:MAG: LysM peptidoglycan-binding domain-containing protein [Acidimicrobiia bacterium]|nr:LysM peptidoglycan-binding domain-containing protein [Acidimicrobiia bacterium]
MRRSSNPRRSSHVVAGVVAVPALVLAGCGRSAPVDALAGLDGDPDIAGVSVTSPDAVVATEPTAPDETVVVTSQAAPQAQATYVVQPGDTLSGIAGTYDVSIEALAQANAIADVHSISPGQQLVIPTPAVEVSVVDTADTTTTAQP